MSLRPESERTPLWIPDCVNRLVNAMETRSFKSNQMKKYTNEQMESMYLDWFNNFASSEKWREHYGLTLKEGDHVWSEGKELNHRDEDEELYNAMEEKADAKRKYGE